MEDVTWTPVEYVEAMASLLLGFVFVSAAVRLAVENKAARSRAERLLGELQEAHNRLQAYAVEKAKIEAELRAAREAAGR